MLAGRDSAIKNYIINLVKNLDIKWVVWIILVFSTSKFDLPVAIRLPFSEVLAFGSLPFLIRSVDFSPFIPRLKIIIFVILLWVFGSIISDFVNANYFQRAIRGVSKPIFVYLWTLFFIIILYKDYRLLLFGVFGTIVAGIQNYILPQSFTAESIAEGGYAAAVYGLTPIVSSSMITCAVWLYIKNRLYSAIICFLMAVFLVIIEAPRSSAATSLVNGSIIGYLWWIYFKRRVFQLNLSRLAIFVVLGTMILFLIYQLYVVLAKNGTLGEFYQQKLESQSSTIFGDSPIGLLLGGRPQFFGALVALMDYPIFGSGSWTAWLMTDYFYDAMTMVGSDDSMVEAIKRGATAGVGHSIILQIWLENGLLALIAMICTLWISIKVFLKTIQHDTWLTPIIIINFTWFFWAFLFSPFDTNARLVIGMFFALYVFDYPRIRQCCPPIRKFSKPRHIAINPKLVNESSSSAELSMKTLQMDTKFL